MPSATYMLIVVMSTSLVVLAFIGGTRIVMRSVTTDRKNSREAEKTVASRLVAKRGDFTGVVADPRSSIGYHLTFETEEGQQLTFFVVGREFSHLNAGDEGDLSFQGTRFNGFVKRLSD